MGIRETLKLIQDDLTFDEPTHIYTYKGEQFTSVTTILKPYFPFDREGIAEKCSKGRNPKYKGKTIEEIYAIWEAKANLGTRVHQFNEDWLNGKFVSVTDQYEAGFLKYLQKLRFDDVITEVQVAHPDWKIAGMIDALIKRDGKWWIYDWKTDASINTTSFSKTEMCPGELCMFQNCNFTKFQMQLGIYRHILATDYYDIEIAGLKVVHCNDEGTVREYTLPYEPDTIDMVLNKYVSTLTP